MKLKGTTALLFRWLSLQLFLLTFGLTASGQTADLSGLIKDPSQAAIPAATISLTRETTGLTHVVSSDGQGLYRFSFLLPDVYTLTAEAAGFRVVTSSGVKLDPGQEARLDFTLMPAGLKQSVTVRGSASSLQTESPAVGTEIDPEFVRNLPLNGRTFQSLIALAPGVVGTVALQNQGDSGGQLSVNGQRDTANYITVDGVSVNLDMGSDPFFAGPSGGGIIPAFNILGATHNLVSLDDMQEFKLGTSTTSAAFGRAVGGQLQIVTRSGSNEFHGALFDYFRNEVLDANDWFANAAGFPRAPLRHNDFGGALGGPIVKDRTFFFFSYEGLRLRQPAVGRIEVPSLSARQAATGAVQHLLSAFPLPNGPEDPATRLGLFTGNFSRLTSSDNTSLRVDHMVNQKLFIFGRYSEAPSNGSGETFQVDSMSVNFRSVTLGATLALSPKATSDLRVNYSRNEASESIRLVPFDGSVPPPDSLLFPAPFASPRSSMIFVNLGFNGFRAGRFADNVQRQGNLVSNTSLMAGRHEVRIGADYRYLAPHYGPFDYRQAIFFAGLPGALSGVATEADIRTFDSVTLGFRNLSLYAQDNWKLNPRLTLIYGLRWELNPPPHASGKQQLSTLTGFPDFASLQLAPQGTPVYKTTYANIAPRFGAAYQLWQRPGTETTVRGGFGIYYDLGVGNIGNVAASFPHLLRKVVRNVAYPLSPQVAAPPPPPSFEPPYSATFTAFGPDHTLPRSYQWNLTVDQRLGANQVLSASYVGEVGRRLLRQSVLFDPNPRFVNSTILITTNASSSDYHALQIQFHRRMSRRLAALLSYTWSHSLDDTSTDIGDDSIAAPRLDRGPSDFDVRHAFNAAFTYNIPKPSRNRALRAILGNWSMNSIFTASAALPINIVVDQDITQGLGMVEARPDMVPDVPLYIYDPTLPGGRRINPAAFSVPAEIRQGNLGRNALRGFPVTQLDLALVRQFSITERIKLQGRADAFNFLNHPNFYVDKSLGDPPLYPNLTFGEGVLMLANSGDLSPLYHGGGPRSIQLSLRLTF